jgi:oxygen-independent coproporphyrinogen-3 oxidase
MRLALRALAEPPDAGSYFIAAYPPFSTWKPSEVAAAEGLLDGPRPSGPLGIYVHIPFCQKKCDYCYYLSFAGKDAGAVASYLETVIEELRLYARLPAVRGRDVSFVYFGGGTPSLLSPDQIRFRGTGLSDALPWNRVREVTFECAPRSTRREVVDAMLEIGVTRVSLGVQSFDDDLLRRNGRIHLAADARRAYRLLREAGFSTINLDLMAGLPGETSDQWRDSIWRAIDLEPDSVTLYPTEMPYNTRTFQDYARGQLEVPPVAWSVKRERVGYGFEELEKAGFAVVSAYAAVKDPARHPFVYQEELWAGGEMLGLGIASFSYVAGAHYQNAAAIDAYGQRVRDGRLPIARARLLQAEERFVRELILQLKLGCVERRRFLEKFGEDVLERFSTPLAGMEAEGWIVTSETGVSLTRAGLLRVDALLPRFYLKEHQGVRYT